MAEIIRRQGYSHELEGLPQIHPRDGRTAMRPYEGLEDFFAEPGEEDGLNLREYWGIILRRKWTVLSFFLIIVSATVASTLLEVPMYRAAATIQIEREPPKVLQFEEVAPIETTGKGFYETQYALLRSRALAERVVTDLDLTRNPVFNPHAGGTAQAAPDPGSRDHPARVTALANALLGGLSVQPVGESRIARLSYDSPNPVLAAKIVNTLAKDFIDMNLERRFGASSYAKTFLEDRLQQVKAKVEESERKLVDFAKAQEIVTGGDGEDVHMQELQRLHTALSEAQQERISAETAYRAMLNARDQGLNPILDSPVIQQLKQTRATLQAQYQEDLKIYKPAYPKMAQLKNQIAEIDSQISVEVKNIQSAIRATYEAAKAKQETFAAKVAELEHEVLARKSQSFEYNVLKREVNTNRQLYDGLLQRMKEVGVAGGIGANNISIVDQAEPGYRFKPNLRKNVTMALVLGLVVGIGMALFFEYLDDTIKGPDDLERRVRLSVLGVVPVVKALRGKEFEGPSVGMLAHHDPKSATAEAYRSLRTSLLFSTAQGAPKVLHFTSSEKGEGKTTSALNTAITFTQTGSKVLLIDADLRRPSIHHLLDLDNSKGLTNYLAGRADPVAVSHGTVVPRLFAIPAGPLPPNPAELLSSAKMMDLLKLAAEKFDYVLVDGPPVLGLADALILANMADGTALVAEAGVVRQGALQATAKRLRSAHATIVGAILSKVTQTGRSYGYYHSYYYYHYRAEDGDSPRQLTA